MKTFLIILSLLLLYSCSNQNPSLVIDKSLIISSGKVSDDHKTGPYDVAYYIETDTYFLVTSLSALHGTKGQAFGGPGTVDHVLMDSFSILLKAVKHSLEVNNKDREIIFYGNLITNKKGKALLHKTKKVLELSHAVYLGKQFVIKR